MTGTTPETARLTADIVLFGETNDGELRVLVIRRGWDPFAGHWALPGGHVDADEDTLAAAHRELAEETGLVLDELHPTRPVTLVGVYAQPGRDPRGRYATWAYTARIPGLPQPTAGDDAADAQWVPAYELLVTPERLAFDHHQIIHDSLRIAI